MLAPCPNVDVVANKHATNPRTAEQPFIAGIGPLMSQRRIAGGLIEKEFREPCARKRKGERALVSLRVGGVTLATILHQPESRAFVHSLVIEKKIRPWRCALVCVRG